MKCADSLFQKKIAECNASKNKLLEQNLCKDRWTSKFAHCKVMVKCDIYLKESTDRCLKKYQRLVNTKDYSEKKVMATTLCFMKPLNKHWTCTTNKTKILQKLMTRMTSVFVGNVAKRKREKVIWKQPKKRNV